MRRKGKWLGKRGGSKLNHEDIPNDSILVFYSSMD